MQRMTKQGFSILMGRTGIELPEEEMEGLKRLFEQFIERLNVLHSVGFEQEEVAGRPLPQWMPEP